jgi:hypothetical protein
MSALPVNLPRLEGLRLDGEVRGRVRGRPVADGQDGLDIVELGSAHGDGCGVRPRRRHTRLSSPASPIGSLVKKGSAAVTPMRLPK